MTDNILSVITDNIFGVWFLIGAALVFFMQCGFAMVETGFTRAKNAGNIIMKNLMDFCIGSVMFILIGYGLMFGEDYIAGLFGLPNLGLIKGYYSSSGDWSNFVFNLVFVLRRLQLFRVLWQKEQSSSRIVFILRLFPLLFILSRQAGFGTQTAGLQNSVFTITQVRRLYIW